MPEARVELGDVTPQNIKQLKMINQVVFPVSYNDKFYRDVLQAGELAKLAYYNDIIVGAVCCRIDEVDGQRRLYIMTLGCLAKYRRHGIGTKMLEHVLNYVEKDGNFDSIFLHVQISNEVAIEFYKKFGFEIIETKDHYYKRIEPADAHVLAKVVRRRPDSEAGGGSGSTSQNGVVASHNSGAVATANTSSSSSSASGGATNTSNNKASNSASKKGSGDRES